MGEGANRNIVCTYVLNSYACCVQVSFLVTESLLIPLNPVDNLPTRIFNITMHTYPTLDYCSILFENSEKPYLGVIYKLQKCVAYVNLER